MLFRIAELRSPTPGKKYPGIELRPRKEITRDSPFCLRIGWCPGADPGIFILRGGAVYWRGLWGPPKAGPGQHPLGGPGGMLCVNSSLSYLKGNSICLLFYFYIFEKMNRWKSFLLLWLIINLLD